MKWLVLFALVACGGSKPPPPPPKAEPPPAPVAKRVPIEDSEVEDSSVTVVNAKGHMDKAAVEAGLSPHHDELSDCYMKNVKRRRWLGGHVLIHWDIKKDGTVTAVKLMAESDLGSWPIEKCLLEVARSASFDKPIGGDADFTLPLDFSAKGASLPWSEDQALRAVGGQLGKLEACDKKHARPHEVTITMYVGAHGRAQSVGFSSDATVIDDQWAECATKAAMGWRLPDPKGIVAKLAVRRP
ncbi:MAG: AgmX/PglI C-terminal domain-containing protein [Deltaproteobacteria bacterium]